MQVKKNQDLIRHAMPASAFNKKLLDTGEVYIEGFASTVGKDRGNDIVYVEGIDTSEYLQNPILLFYHTPEHAVGRVVSLDKRPEGLWVKAMISSSETELVTYVRDLIREKILTTFSIGYKALNEEPDAAGINHVRQSKLFEISVVALPMNKDCTFQLAKKELTIRENLSYKDLNDMLVKEIGDTHEADKEGTSGQSSINEPVEGTTTVSASDPAPQEEATPHAEDMKEMKIEIENESEEEDTSSAETAEANDDEARMAEESASEEKEVSEPMAEEIEKPSERSEKPIEQKLEAPFDAEGAVARFIDDAEMVETGDATTVPAWVSDAEIWSKARQASIDTWGDASFPFIVYAYFTAGGRASGAPGTDTTPPEEGGEMIEAACSDPLKKKELAQNPASGQPLLSQTQNEDPHLKASEQTNVMLGSIASLMQTMVSKLDTLCQNTQPVQAASMATNDSSLEQKEMDELERKILDLDTKLKMLS